MFFATLVRGSCVEEPGCTRIYPGTRTISPHTHSLGVPQKPVNHIPNMCCILKCLVCMPCRLLSPELSGLCFPHLLSLSPPFPSVVGMLFIQLVSPVEGVAFYHSGHLKDGRIMRFFFSHHSLGRIFHAFAPLVVVYGKPERS